MDWEEVEEGDLVRMDNVNANTKATRATLKASETMTDTNVLQSLAVGVFSAKNRFKLNLLPTALSVLNGMMGVSSDTARFGAEDMLNIWR